MYISGLQIRREVNIKRRHIIGQIFYIQTYNLLFAGVCFGCCHDISRLFSPGNVTMEVHASSASPTRFLCLQAEEDVLETVLGFPTVRLSEGKRLVLIESSTMNLEIVCMQVDVFVYMYLYMCV